MIRFAVLRWTLLIAALLSLPAQAAPLIPQHEGYAFDQPRLLVEQRLFGITHGVILLAATCVSEPEYREVLIPVYEQWHEMQQATIEQIRFDLARHYFGERAPEATWADIARALKLKSALGLKPGSKDLQAACNSFAEALQKPEYDLYQLSLMMNRLAAAKTIEAKVSDCLAIQSEEPRAALDEAMVAWHKTYDVGITEARTLLERRWPDPEFARALDRWLNQKVQPRAQPVQPSENAASATATENAQACEAIPAWLLTKQADPDDEPKPNP